MKLCKFLVLLVLFACSPSYGQYVFVKGKVLSEKTMEPLEYATVSFTSKRDTLKVVGGITSADGSFSIKLKRGVYNVKFEFIGYQAYIVYDSQVFKNQTLEDVLLEEDHEALQEVVVKGEEKQAFENLFDKKVYNVGKDITVSGGNVLDLLSNVPLVSVSEEGISVRGNPNVRILINGKPSGLSGIGRANDASSLQALQASSVSTINVVTNPSSRYDAEGTAGIIDIILKKNENTSGSNGSAQVTVGNPHNYQGAININYRKEFFNVFANGGLRYIDRPNRGSRYSTYYDDKNNVSGYLSEARGQRRVGTGLLLSFGSDFYITQKQTLTLMGLITKDYVDQIGRITYDTYDASNAKTSSHYRDEKTPETLSNNEFSVSYESFFGRENKHSLATSTKYDSNQIDNTSNYTNTYTYGVGANGQDRSSKNQYQRNLLFQADYRYPFKENAFISTGYKSNFRTMDYEFILESLDITSNAWKLNPSVVSNFQYKEGVHAFYGQYANTFDKIKLQAGMRSEISSIQALNNSGTFDVDKSYINFFPSVNINYKLTDVDELKLSYGRRIRRPTFQELAPLDNFANNVNIISGNPDLNPMYTNIYEGGYGRNWKDPDITLNTMGYTQYSTDIIQAIIVTAKRSADNVPVLIKRPLNTGTEQRYGVEVNVGYKPLSWLHIMSDVNAFYYERTSLQSLPITDINGQRIEALQSTKYNASSWYARLTPTVTLKNSLKIQLRMNYNGAYKEINQVRGGFFFANMSIEKDFFNKRGNLNFTVIDMFNSRYNYTNASGTGFRLDDSFQFAVRQINLTFTYRLKDFVEKHIAENTKVE